MKPVEIIRLFDIWLFHCLKSIAHHGIGLCYSISLLICSWWLVANKVHRLSCVKYAHCTTEQNSTEKPMRKLKSMLAIFVFIRSYSLERPTNSIHAKPWNPTRVHQSITRACKQLTPIAIEQHHFLPICFIRLSSTWKGSSTMHEISVASVIIKFNTALDHNC